MWHENWDSSYTPVYMICPPNDDLWLRQFKIKYLNNGISFICISEHFCIVDRNVFAVSVCDCVCVRHFSNVYEKRLDGNRWKKLKNKRIIRQAAACWQACSQIFTMGNMFSVILFIARNSSTLIIFFWGTSLIWVIHVNRGRLLLLKKSKT